MTIRWGWQAREEPLPPCAVFASGAAALALVDRLLSRSGSLEGLSGVAGGGCVVLAASDPGRLPWVAGVRYLGRPPLAAALRLPTTRRPDIPEDLLQRALLARARPGEAPLAVLEDRVVPLGPALPLHREVLAAWRAAS